MTARRTSLVVVLLLAALDLAVAHARSAPPPPDPLAGLPQRDRDWLEEVAPLITEAERQVFVGLQKDYQRQMFERAFWQARDPYPQTPVNELRVAWQERIEALRSPRPFW